MASIFYITQTRCVSVVGNAKYEKCITINIAFPKQAAGDNMVEHRK